ncbi:glycosyl transferase family 90 [Pedobacter sp. UBA5917]|uniref:glycosyl transferase family 90 n=1 Tax=Pedobacter sp. UBA5917 TaxID=1947061 RepID=UPI0025DC31DF|nr:glycosyl transferase family 90 [Pedobacter sp. UBA5917]
MDAIKLGIDKDQSFSLHTGDFPLGDISPNNFYYCCDRKENLHTAFPDFIFDHWQQAGIKDFNLTVKEITEASSQAFVNNTMLWIGNVQTHPNRKKIIEYSQQFPELIETYDTCVDQHVIDGKKVPYISLADHTKYKYLIDIEGRGYSGRIKLLLYTKRLLFIQERQWKSYYHFELEPYKHFIPVKNDMSDLIQQIEFIEKQGQAYYENIVNNAFNFAAENLNYESAVKRIQNLLNSNL